MCVIILGPVVAEMFRPDSAKCFERSCETLPAFQQRIYVAVWGFLVTVWGFKSRVSRLSGVFEGLKSWLWSLSRGFGVAMICNIQKNPRVHKIRVRNSGAGNGCANFMGAWKNALFLQENQCP